MTYIKQEVKLWFCLSYC